MKKILMIILVLISSISFGQKKLKSSDSISHFHLEKIEGYKNIVDVSNYQMIDKTWIKLGDTLVVGKPNNQNNLQQNSYTNGATNNHTYIFLGSSGALMMGTAFYANENMIGDKMVVTGIRIGRISKKQPYEVLVEFNKAGGGRFLSTKKIARANVDKAITSGEIINPRAPMNRTQAIAKLKEAKELLDIEMMTKDEFEALKKELAPIIKSQN